MKIAFYTPHLTFRGSCVALKDYAHYNETLLNNHSLITTPKLHSQSSSDNNECAYDWFKNRFPIYFYDSLDQLEEYLLQNKYDLIYCIKHGQLDEIQFHTIPYVVHCVFDMSCPHGNVYAGVSQQLARKFNSDLYVPHMVSLTSINLMGDLRDSLNIPNDAIVFGRYGGIDTFNLIWAMEVMSLVVERNPNIYFLFMNTPQWILLSHPQIIHIPPISNCQYKKRFIQSCDAMIVPETLGHTFGLSIAEFQVFHKPIICFNGNVWNTSHLEVLGEEGFYFKTPVELYTLLTTWKKGIKSKNMYSEYTPNKVIQLFESLFIL